MAKIIFVLCTFLFALSMATQKLAQLIEYDVQFLGSPLFVSNNIPYYLPTDYLVWWYKFHEYIPDLFSQTYIYLGVATFIVFFYILWLNKPTKAYDSHGSARWADENDLNKMEIKSNDGVLLGLYDTPLKKLCTKFIRSFELYKKERFEEAEKNFASSQAKELEALQYEVDNLHEKLLLTENADYKKIIQKNIDLKEAKLSSPTKYNPSKNNDYYIAFLNWSYKKAFNWYKTLSHNYLRDNGNRHLAVVAPTRSGKGVGLIVPTLLGGWQSSVVVNDIKSENWGITAGYRKRMGQTVIKFEPTCEDGSTARWNPVDEIPIGTPDEVSLAQNLAATIADYEGKGKPDHWTANAAQVITAVILHLKYAYYVDRKNYPTTPSLFTVASFLKANIVPKVDDNGNPVYVDEEKKEQALDPKGFLDTLQSLQNFNHVPDAGIEIEEWDTIKCEYTKRKFTPSDLRKLYPNMRTLDIMPNIHPIIYQSFVEILSKPANECGSIISTANTALKEYLDPILARNTSKSDFCIDDIMNYKKPVSLYLVTPPSDILRLAPILRLFFELSIRKHIKTIGEYKNGQAISLYKHKCLFLMDEFASLGNLQSLVSALAYVAGYGLKIFLINQGLPQINQIYSKDNQILMNVHLQIFYAPNDNDTAAYAEKLVGNKTITVESVQKAQGFFEKTTVTKSQTARALMTSDEFKRLGEREVISVTQYPPLLTDKIKYYENNFFLKKLFDAPAVSDIIRPNAYSMRDELIKKHNDEIKKKYSYHFEYDENIKVDEKVAERM